MSQRFTAASICHPEDEVYEVYDFVLFIGYNVKCREPCLLICQKHGSYSLPRGGGDWRETGVRLSGQQGWTIVLVPW